jgi:tRNA/rRNA methyltransferase/tRNA (cytidine32/uridine32-2'-O)-methyltransferase
MFLSDIVIILSRVSESGNVGAVCRAMKNMGLSRLRLAAPGPIDEKTIVSRAIHAVDVWKNSQIYDSLAQAAADCSLLVGTTRRRGRKRKSVTIEPGALAEWLIEKYAGGTGETGPIAIIFGNERTGLDDDELNLCTIASHIPVSEDFPSLNLSHAVQIYAYELFLACSRHEIQESGRSVPDAGIGPVVPVKGEWIPMERHQVDELTASITATLANLGFYQNPGREEQTRFLRDLMSRAGLTEREGQYLAKIFAKAARLGSKAYSEKIL